MTTSNNKIITYLDYFFSTFQESVKYNFNEAPNK